LIIQLILPSEKLFRFNWAGSLIANHKMVCPYRWYLCKAIQVPLFTNTENILSISGVNYG